MLSILGPTFPLLADINTALRDDSDTNSLIKQLEEGNCYNPKLQWRNNLLFLGNRIYIPNNVELQNKIIVEFHDSKIGDHADIKATTARVASNFFWPKLVDSIQQFVKKRLTCVQT